MAFHYDYIIDEKEVRGLDPNVKTHRYALYSPATATVDPVEICMALKKELQDQGSIFTGMRPMPENTERTASSPRGTTASAAEN